MIGIFAISYVVWLVYTVLLIVKTEAQYQKDKITMRKAFDLYKENLLNTPSFEKPAGPIIFLLQYFGLPIPFDIEDPTNFPYVYDILSKYLDYKNDKEELFWTMIFNLEKIAYFEPKTYLRELLYFLELNYFSENPDYKIHIPDFDTLLDFLLDEKSGILKF